MIMFFQMPTYCDDWIMKYELFKTVILFIINEQQIIFFTDEEKDR